MRSVFRPEPPAFTPDERRSARLARDDLPFIDVDSIAGCGYRGTLVAMCIASEESLRSKAQALWADASMAKREDCLDRTRGANEPVGVLYACLTYSQPAPNLD